MPNTSRIKGFAPAKHLQGSGYFGTANWYHVPASDGTAIYVGDVVKLAGSADSTGKPTVTLASAADAVLGVVIGFSPNRDDLNIAGQKRAASTARDVLVVDDPNVIFEVEVSNGTPTAADTGLNFNHAVGSPDAATARSGAYADWGTEATTAALTFKFLSLAPRVDNEVGASQKILCKINNHQFHGTGVLGV